MKKTAEIYFFDEGAYDRAIATTRIICNRYNEVLKTYYQELKQPIFSQLEIGILQQVYNEGGASTLIKRLKENEAFQLQDMNPLAIDKIVNDIITSTTARQFIAKAETLKGSAFQFRLQSNPLDWQFFAIDRDGFLTIDQERAKVERFISFMTPGITDFLALAEVVADNINRMYEMQVSAIDFVYRTDMEEYFARINEMFKVENDKITFKREYLHKSNL